MFKKYMFVIIGAVMLFSSLDKVSAEEVSKDTTLRTTNIIQNNMVLQRDMKLPIWGYNAGGTTVTVKFNGQEKSGVTADTGKWIVYLDPMPAGGPYEMDITSTDGSSLHYSNVMLGEVWLCAGQSNMDRPLTESNNAAAVIADAKNRNMRIYNVIEKYGDYNSESWVQLDSSNAGGYSSVAYFFGQEIQRYLGNDITIGLYVAAIGSTAISQWTNIPEGGVEPNDAFEYKSKIVPCQPFGIRGAIWYQGESDGLKYPVDKRTNNYYKNLKGLIEEWRRDFGQGDFPFYIVQLAYYQGLFRWCTVREAQLRAIYNIKNTGLACATDLKDYDIHPGNKEPVGYRLALWAKAKIYGSDEEYSGPLIDYENSYVKGNKVYLKFTHVGGGLMSIDGNKVIGPFKVAGPDGEFYEAKGSIEGKDTVVVKSFKVSKPVKLRFWWDYDPHMNLYNDVKAEYHYQKGEIAYLPAPPFQIDLSTNPPTPGDIRQ